MDKLSFVERNFEIHGALEGYVYRRKRNGELEKYPYEPVSHYERVPLEIRNEWIRRYAARVSNPRQQNYSSIIKRFNYYTPYILPVGEQALLGETVFYVRKREEFEFRFSSMPVGIKRVVGKRTKVKFNFDTPGELVLNCYREGELYCERWFIITENDLDGAYEAWLEVHLAEILEAAEPPYSSLKTYRRGMRSRGNWLKGLEGACYDDIIYRLEDYGYKDQKGENPWYYHRRRYDHSDNPQTRIFCARLRELGEEWRALSASERAEWNIKAAGYRKRRLSGFNLFVMEKG